MLSPTLTMYTTVRCLHGELAAVVASIGKEYMLMLKVG